MIVRRGGYTGVAPGAGSSSPVIVARTCRLRVGRLAVFLGHFPRRGPSLKLIGNLLREDSFGFCQETHMNRCWGILLLLAVAALPARAHFIRILPGQAVERQSTARGIFAVAQAGHTGSTSRRHADPAATRLLAEARAA